MWSKKRSSNLAANAKREQVVGSSQIDGFTQKLTSYESTNFRRFVTGFLFGIGLVGIIADMTISCFYSGVEYGKALRNRR